ncbi:hypothetical protein SISNIDRAFT_540130 [Sistotremastrum niveocremeum HHB9708]|uniref:Condensation domain-containing protein n=1 Tax=Sistotremastrum niveocremeum HHB9708 TaxID=1314777 RepID=A0A164XJQ9_9AGAM|nr:hypothetical protein SISNIDRAFT_540130 [Sistotremastrum niveocremeum HHB9708]
MDLARRARSPESVLHRRRLGHSELSYFLPSRANGVNDMYLHIGFKAPSSLLSPERVLLAWAILRARHPLLASCVKYPESKYEEAEFIYAKPQSPGDVLREAESSFSTGTIDKDTLIDSYLNGPRVLGPDHLSHLFLATHDRTDANRMQQFDLLLAATHFLGDGMALHTFANDLFSLLVRHSPDAEPEDSLYALFQQEWRDGCGAENLELLPPALEDRLPRVSCSRLKNALELADFNQTQDRVIGGHTFPRPSPMPAERERHTVVPTISFTPERTKAILKKCKTNGVSISSALFALVAVVWARTARTMSDAENLRWPIMLYSAMNMRPYLPPLAAEQKLHDSYWFLAIGYFNIILPSFVPEGSSLEAIFWHRARSAKAQAAAAAKSQFLVSRTRLMAESRAKRAIKWAAEDDEKEKPVTVPSTKPSAPKPPSKNIPSSQVCSKTPSQCLMGLSLLGNLDGMYDHALYSNARMSMHSLTTGSRQRQGGMLLFGYTFAGKLWLSLGYDENGFKRGTVEEFWSDVVKSVGTFMG